MLGSGQVVNAKLGGHVSSSTLSAYQMARAREVVDSVGSVVWIRMHDGDTDQSNFWNRRTRGDLLARSCGCSGRLGRGDECR